MVLRWARALRARELRYQAVEQFKYYLHVAYSWQDEREINHSCSTTKTKTRAFIRPRGVSNCCEFRLSNVSGFIMGYCTLEAEWKKPAKVQG